MGALGNDPALIKNHNPVGRHHRCQTMGNDQRCPVFHQACQRGLHGALGFGIQCAGGLIEQEYLRIAQDRARNGDTLSLAAGQPHAFFTQKSIEPFGQRIQKSSRRSRFGSIAHFGIRGIRAAISDVFPGIRENTTGS